MVGEVDDMEVRVVAASSVEVEREIGSKKSNDGDGSSAQALDSVRSHEREGEEGGAPGCFSENLVRVPKFCELITRRVWNWHDGVTGGSSGHAEPQPVLEGYAFVKRNVFAKQPLVCCKRHQGNDGDDRGCERLEILLSGV